LGRYKTYRAGMARDPGTSRDEDWEVTGWRVSLKYRGKAGIMTTYFIPA